jgi:hypothetical protein
MVHLSNLIAYAVDASVLDSAPQGFCSPAPEENTDEEKKGTSSLNEISTNQLGNRLVVGGAIHQGFLNLDRYI